MLSKCFDSNRSVFKGWFLKAKQRFGFGYDYMSFSLMRGNNLRTTLQPHFIKLVTQAFKVSLSHLILHCFS